MGAGGKEALERIRTLVGSTVTAEQLKYVDCYVGEEMGLFLPSVGHCGYAVTAGHSHPSYSFVIFPTGAQGIIPFEAFPASDEYEAAMLPPETPHEEKAGDDFLRYFAFFISVGLAEKCYAAYGHPAWREHQKWHNGVWSGFGVPKTVMQLVYRYMDACEEVIGDGAGGALLLPALETLIASELIRSQMADGRSAGKKAENAVLQRAFDHLHQNYHKPVSVGQLAALCAMSESTFSRRFKEETGSAPAGYLVQLRLHKAKKLIVSGSYTMTEIALKCGFGSAAHFTSAFRKEFGVSPSEFSKMMGI